MDRFLATHATSVTVGKITVADTRTSTACQRVTDQQHILYRDSKDRGYFREATEILLQ